YRIRDYEILLGDPVTEVVHKEHGYLLKLDPTKVYFSPREATERQRVAVQVRPGEYVMLMFAGVGPYAFAILKHQPHVDKIIAIELNPIAYKYLLENVKLNKAEGKVIPVLGDVREKASQFYGLCDRVIMPLPRGAYLFLKEAFYCLKPEGGIVHIYHWAPEERPYDEIGRIIHEEASKYGFEVQILNRRKVLPYAPRIVKVCVEFKARKILKTS
ncbi:MAG: class I SAM-dependent methyltransferase family protein, partial [Thermoprotei archaeon]